MAGKAKRKKASNFKTSEQRSVFLYGKPNVEKRCKLARIQTNYTSAVNTYISLLTDNEDLLLPLLCRDRKNSELRSFEKENRVNTLTSALSQSAFDYAVDRLATRLEDIKAYAYEKEPSLLTSSKILFTMCVQNKSSDEMVHALQDVIDAIKKHNDELLAQGKTPKSGKTEFYENAINTLVNMADEDFESAKDTICLLYSEGSLFYKIPHVKRACVRLVSTLFSLEESDGISAPYVIAITDPERKGQRIEVPLYTSQNSIRRLKQYGAKHSVEYTIRKDGNLKVTVAFEKKHVIPTIKEYRGVDVGITDALYTSTNQAFGTFVGCADFYDNNVLPLAGELSSIRNKKSTIKHYLDSHPNLPPDVKKCLRDKIDRLESMLRKDKEYGHRLNRYSDMQKQEIKNSVQSYISSLGGDKGIATVLELLDIKEFEASKKSNRRRSMFARGLLSKTLMDTLNWYGYPYIQVEPAFTSQACPICFYTAKENRNNKEFHCKCCGYTDDADHVGSLNITSRAEDTEILELCDTLYGQKRRDAIHALLDKRHEEWLKLNQAEAAS